MRRGSEANTDVLHARMSTGDWGDELYSRDALIISQNQGRGP